MTEWTEKYDVDPETGCYVWNRARQTRGYGAVWFRGRVHLAHRVAWFLANDSWPDPSRVVDHVCNNKACVNPDHLRELSNSLNIRRAYPRGDARTERMRAQWRAANARRRTYAADYTVGGE